MDAEDDCQLSPLERLKLYKSAAVERLCDSKLASSNIEALTVTYDGVGESGVHDLLIWGFWLAVISLAGLVPLLIWRVAAWRDRMSRVNSGT